MNHLKEHVERLLTLYVASLRDTHITENISIIENLFLEPNNQVVVSKSQLIDICSYTERFEYLKRVGYTWLNLTIIGILNEHLIVGIEIPKHVPSTLSNETHINLSGPMNFVAKEDLDLSKYIRITENA
jgi:hypothetical protein